MHESATDLTRAGRMIAAGQAGYFVVTGIWSIVGINSFQKITGPKVDTWLVKTVGALVIAIGAVLGMAAWRRNGQPEIPALAIGSAAGLAAIDVVYASRGRISPIYLLDAIAEAGLIVGWLLALRRGTSDGG
jgi:hypothetical protein